MHVQITVRGGDLSDKVRERAETLVGRWPRYEPAASAVRLVFEVHGPDHVVEAVVSRDRQDAVVATGQGSDFRAALDELDERATRILRRDHQKRKKHQHPPTDQLG